MFRGSSSIISAASFLRLHFMCIMYHFCFTTRVFTERKQPEQILYFTSSATVTVNVAPTASVYDACVAQCGCVENQRLPAS